MSSEDRKPTHLQARGVSKSFEGNTVLREVDLAVASGEIHAVVGENGAGKSTLMKILGGVYAPDSGNLAIANQPYRPRSPKDAIDHGLVVIHQEFSLTPHLSAEENIFLGHYPVTRYGTVDRRAMRERTLQLLERLSIRIDPGTPVTSLSVAQQQMVEIAKALSLDARALILDEPTAVLDEENVEVLFRVLRRLREEGLAIVYISHHLEEIFEIADKVTVLRDGAKTGSADVNEIDHDWLVARMIGRGFPDHRSQSRKHGEVALEVSGLTRKGKFEDISFFVRRGEIVALAGLVGAGRSEIAQAIFGLHRPDAGTMRVFGRVRRIRNPGAATRLGIAYTPEDRKSHGLFLNRPTSENITMSVLKRFYRFPIMRLRHERAFVERMVASLDVRLPGLGAEVRNLSGGNQQKVLLARSLAAEPKILLLDEPTRGVDIGAKQEIYDFIEQLVGQGMAIVLISSEMEEILRLADRIIVLRRGRIARTMDRTEASEDAMMKAAALSQATPA
ncbi:MAG: sugar ABC transporter ATP-binding protein [Trueperaceae bacterium]